MPKKYLQKEQHSANRYTEPAYQEMPLQEEMPLQLDLHQTEERMSAPAAGEAVARRMAECLPFGGEGPEPPNPPRMPPQEETAPRTKREKSCSVSGRRSSAAGKRSRHASALRCSAGRRRPGYAARRSLSVSSEKTRSGWKRPGARQTGIFFLKTIMCGNC